MSPHTDALPSDDNDPRYSLANERTFLAWIRTALGLLALAVGIRAIDLPWPIAVVRSAAALLAILGGFSAVYGWSRWRSVNLAVQAGVPAPAPKAHIVLVAAVALIGVAIAVLAFA